MIRDKINGMLEDNNLGEKYKCKKVFVDESIDRTIDSESNIIYNNQNIPVFDCGWAEWENRTNEFISSQY
jgi:hypothetical protein